MKINIDIFAGICGFRTKGTAQSPDDQYVTFILSSDCDKLSGLIQKLKKIEPFDSFLEISSNPDRNAKLLDACRKELSGCCSGCVVPSGLFKAMQVAAGLALPKDINISLSKDI